MPNPVLVGDVLIGVFNGAGVEFGGAVFNITDSLGNTWTKVVGELQNTFFYAQNAEIWWAKVTTAGTCTITANTTSGYCQSFIVIKAPAGVSAVDVSGGSNSGNPTITTTATNDFIVTGGMAVFIAPTATSPEEVEAYGLAQVGYAPGSGTGIAGVALSWVNATSAGSFTSSLAMNQTTGGSAAIVTAAFVITPPGPTPQTTNVIANPQGTVTHSVGALTSGEPVIGHGGGDITVGTKTGVTSEFASVSAVGSTGQPALWESTGDLGAGVVGQLVPPGGSTGQVLSKTSGTDYATAWATPMTGTHSEPLTDGNSNFIFADGDIVVVVGVPN